MVPGGGSEREREGGGRERRRASGCLPGAYLLEEELLEALGLR